MTEKVIRPLWEHQKKVVDYINDFHVNHYALFHDMGAGKTRTSIDILRGKSTENKRLLKTLIITPVATLENWRREIIANSHIPANMISVIDGVKPGGKVSNLKTKKEQLDKKYGIYIINTESVGNANLWPIIEKLGIEFLIVDESHRFKNPTAKRTKDLMSFSRGVKYKYILTGSPVLQNALDLWAQFYILNPAILGANFFSFRSQYFYDANYAMPSHIHFPDWKPKDEKYFNRMKRAGMSEEALQKESFDNLNAIIYRHANRVMKSEVLDLPPITYQVLESSMSKEQERLYTEMEDHLIANLDEIDDADLDDILELDSDIIEADLAITKTLRLMQICAGVIKPDEKDAFMMEKLPRLKLLEETLEEILTNADNKIIIWTIFKPSYEAIGKICEKLGVKFVYLTGLQKQSEKVANIDAFNNDESVRVIIANQGAGGTGVNLTRANYAIYYSRGFNLEHDLQSEARNYRGGQVRNVTRIDIITKNTIDERIVQALASKKDHAADILEKRERGITKEEIKKLIRGN